MFLALQVRLVHNILSHLQSGKYPSLALLLVCLCLLHDVMKSYVKTLSRGTLARYYPLYLINFKVW